MELSAKTQENGESYTRLTAQNPSAATSRQRSRAERVGMKLLGCRMLQNAALFSAYKGPRRGQCQESIASRSIIGPYASETIAFLSRLGAFLSKSAQNCAFRC